MMRLNKHGYEQLINEDIEWLQKVPRSLERDHIIAVLKASIKHEYPEAFDLLPEPCVHHGKAYCGCDQ
jgi:hypothetical protein